MMHIYPTPKIKCSLIQKFTFLVKKTDSEAAADNPEPSELRSNFSLTIFTKESASV